MGWVKKSHVEAACETCLDGDERRGGGCWRRGRGGGGLSKPAAERVLSVWGAMKWYYEYLNCKRHHIRGVKTDETIALHAFFQSF